MRARIAACGLALGLASANAFAQSGGDFEELIAKSEARIESSLEEYMAFLQRTANEKLELIGQINRLENALVQQRAHQRNAEQLAAQQKADLDALNSRIDVLDTQAQYSLGVLSEYLTNFESRTHVAEDQLYMDQLREMRERLDRTESVPNERIPIFFDALAAGLERQEALIGGRRFPGRAITPSGGVKEGTVALIGPVAYFHSNDSSAAGILAFNSGTIEPGLTPLPAAESAGLAQLAIKGEGPLPLDASLGKALALKSAKGTLLQHVAKGGWVGYAILALGGLSILIALIKSLDLQSSKARDPGDIGALADDALAPDPAPAKARASALGGPIGAMIATGIDFARADTETILEAMETVILRHRPKLERFLPFLAMTAAVAPLMGLLGTVVGMIKTFTLIEVFGTGDARSLSSGISEALVTTELGLVVAIPALILHGIFTRIMRSRIGNMEHIAADFSRRIALRRGES